MNPLPRLELVCFGPPAALLGERPAPAEGLGTKHLAFLIYLALSPEQRRTREHLVGVFWGERRESRARGNLSVVLHRLRASLGEGRLRSEGHALVLTSEALEVDALRFESAATDRPEEAAALVRGDFLEGFQVQDAPEFDDWATRERRRYRALAVESLVVLGEKHLLEHRLAEAGAAGRRALSLAPHSEPAIRLVMHAAVLGGDGTAALAAFHEFAGRFQRDTGEEAPRALTALAERVRQEGRRIRASRTETGGEPALVGRLRVHQEAFDALQRGLRGNPQTLVISGEPGMGRTRLLSECARRADLEGALVVFARPLEHDQDAPWSTLRLLLRDRLATAPGLPAAPTGAVAALAGFSPALAERFSPRETRDVADVAASLRDALAAVADECSLLIALDDAHWADGTSLAALRAAVASMGHAPLVLALTVVAEATEPGELLALQSEVGRALPGTSIRLDRLTGEDLRALVDTEAPWCADPADRDRLTRRLERETGGSPFFAVTLLRALQRATTLRTDLVTWPPPEAPTDAPFPFSIPNLLRHAMGARLTDLADENVLVLRAASVCGQEIDPELVAFVAQLDAGVIERALPLFERRHLIAFDGRRYAFVAPLVAEVVQAQCLTKGERRRLERRVIEGLGKRADLESRARRAELLAGVAPSSEAFDEVLAVTRDALEAGARRIARRGLAAADRIVAAISLDRTGVDALRARLTPQG